MYRHPLRLKRLEIRTVMVDDLSQGTLMMGLHRSE